MFTNLQYGGTMPFAKTWRCADRVFDLSARPLIMGILNVTPDSFSDGGDHNKLDDAVAWARRMAAHGADIIDVGGESTRPGSSPVSLEEESRRVLPVVEALAAEGFVVSVDTSRPEVMTAAAKAGAKILNDVRGFDLTGAAEAAAATDCGLVVMHGFDAPRGSDIVAAVYDYLAKRTTALRELGVSSDRICWDPGFGFGKTVEGNFELIAATLRFASSGQPLMAAVSRKSELGAVIGREVPKDRTAASAACAVIACGLGAQIVRVHDVAETRDELLVLAAIEKAAARLVH